MGTWHLEVAKMVLYIGFPVALFHWFNQPENFSKHVEKTRGMYMVPEDPNAKERYEDFVNKFNSGKDNLMLQQMEEKLHNK